MGRFLTASNLLLVDQTDIMVAGLRKCTLLQKRRVFGKALHKDFQNSNLSVNVLEDIVVPTVNLKTRRI